MKNDSTKVPLDAASALILLIGTILGSTWRYRISGNALYAPSKAHPQGIIYGLWHAHLLPLTYIFRNTGKTAVVSSSRDGKRAAAVAMRWKHDIIFGSSTRGGSAAFRNCIELLKQNKDIVITPDGPRGPREVVKEGIARIALNSGAPVVGLSAVPEKCWRLKSWDRMMIPKPFTKITIHVSDPLDPLKFSGADSAEHLMSEIRKILTV